MKEEEKWLYDKLESWRSTFDNETDEDNEVEGDEKGYDEITKLMDKIKNFKPLTPKDYENILYHLWQQNSGVEE